MDRILVLAPHADDGEFGCGASLKRFSDEGAEIFYAAFSPCQISMPLGSKERQLYDELEKAVSHLGIKTKNIFKFDFQVRIFAEYRQQILDTLINLRKEIQPNLVLLPNSDDIHQDHQVIHNEGRRAFKNISILGYELPWNNRHFLTNYYITVNETHLEAKAKAIAEYQSQTFRHYMDIDFFKGLARVRGIQANADYAEAFEVIKWVY
ncbi:MAG: PIG-L family deacetylase [bacterium]|nr:PIG-L family deacetylase [bacterium]